MDGEYINIANPEVITYLDIKAAGYCIHLGARRWCAAHGIDFRRLMLEGIPVEDVAHINDAMLARILEVKRGQ